MEGLGGLPRTTRGVQKAAVVSRHASSDFVDKHYETLELIGEGSFGQVSRVRELKTGEERVCKVVSTAGIEPRLLEMLRKEIEMLCVLDHPHIVKIFEYALDETREELVLVLEHLAGGDCLKLLAEALEADTMLNEALVARLMHQVFLALSYCHSQGVLHRDIKPDNMILTGEDMLGIADCKVIDFGVAVRDDRPERGIFGTLSHIAPEVASQSGDIYTPKADVWAAGVTTFQLLTGMMPFGRPTVSKGCRAGLRHISKYKSFDEEVLPKVANVHTWEYRSPQAQDFVRWLLTADPAKRPTCSEVLEHPWLQMYKAETESLTQEMKDSLVRYPNAPPLVRCCLYAIAARQNIPDLERFGAAFLRIDREGKGKLSPSDLAAVLGRQSMPVTIKADHLLDAADLSHTGDLSFTEFVAACLYSRHVQSGTLEDLLRSAFEALDADRDGLVSIDEVRELFRERDTPFLESLPQDEPFDLKTWCSTLQAKCATRPAKPTCAHSGQSAPQRQVSFQPVATTTAATDRISGTWQTSFGEVRLSGQNSGTYLGVPDTISGIKWLSSTEVHGHFYNASLKKRGQFRWIFDVPSFTHFRGTWSWDDGSPALPDIWSGSCVSRDKAHGSNEKIASFSPPILATCSSRNYIATVGVQQLQAQHGAHTPSRLEQLPPQLSARTPARPEQLQPQLGARTPARPPPNVQSGMNHGYPMPNLLSAPSNGFSSPRGYVGGPKAENSLPAHLQMGLQQGWITTRQPLATVRR
jgi:calcium-dependent protein kinase